MGVVSRAGTTRSRWSRPLCAAAVLGGMGSFTAIAGWVADVPAEVLARLYARPARSPSKTTLWRVLTGADAPAVDAVVGAWLLAQATAHAGQQCPPGRAPGEALVAIAVDARDRPRRHRRRGQPDPPARRGHPPRLSGPGSGRGRRENQRDPMFAPLLENLAAAGVDLGEVVITADALCRHRHKASYEDVRVMPMCWPGPLLAAASRTAWSA